MEDDITSDSTSNATSEIFGPDGTLEQEEEHYDFRDLSSSCNTNDERILDLEQEQEKLTGSLLALTSHFGQVQFRLKQIIE